MHRNRQRLDRLTKLRVSAHVLPILAAALVLAGCGQSDVRVYTVPKEKPESAVANRKGGTEPAGPVQVRWTLPKGWQEKPAGGMRVGSFAVSGKAGEQADISIIPLAGLAGGELGNVNRWRSQIGLEPITAEQLDGNSEKIAIGEIQARLFDMTAAKPGANEQEPARMLAAILIKDETTWFFKMTGPHSLVAQEKPAFEQLLKSIQFVAAPSAADLPPDHPPLDTAAAPQLNPANPAKPAWTIPAGWQEQAGPGMRIGSFAVAGADNAQADISVIMLEGEGGGLLANINRWRGQIGLSPTTDDQLAKESESISLDNGKATLVDLLAKDGKTRMIGAIVPRDGQMWFYKMTGDDKLVAEEKPAFIKFVQTVRYPHDH